MKVNTSGINEHQIDKLTIDIMEYADRINKVLNQIQELVNSSGLYLKSESGNTFRENFKLIEKNYQTMNQNILSYARDFVKVKAIYRNQILNIADRLTKKND